MVSFVFVIRVILFPLPSTLVIMYLYYIGLNSKTVTADVRPNHQNTLEVNYDTIFGNYAYKI